MKKEFSKHAWSEIKPRVMRWMKTATMALIAVSARSSMAQTNPYSFYIPTAVTTATTTLYSAGSTSIAPGRVGVDKLGNVFYVNHTSGTSSTLYEIPAASPAATITSPTPLVSGLGALNSNSVFVDASGALWVSNGNGAGAALVEIPAASGVPNIAAIKANSGYVATGLPIGSLTTACTASATAPCVWSASSINSSFTSLQVGDVYSDGAGNVYLVDIADNVSSGSYNRMIQFKTSAAGTVSVLADKLATNAYAQVTVAGDGNVYYCDSATGNASGGLVSVVSNGALTTVGNTGASNLTLLNAIVKVSAATGITTDPWGDLVISGPKQLSEVPLEVGALNFLDQFNLLIAVSGSNSPVATNNVTYGGTIDVHGNYYFASATNVMLVEVGGHNFGQVNVGTEITTAAPYFAVTWDIPTQLVASGSFPTASPSTLSAANAGFLQSFPNGNSKNFYGGTPYSASTTGSYLLMYFQPVHAGLLRGSDAPQGYPNALAAADPGGATVGATDYAANPAYTVNLQGVGVGPQPMFLPGIASKAVSLSQLYTSQSHTTKAVGFTPQAVAVDTYGDIFVTDTTNSSLDVSCLAATANTAAALSSFCQANGPGYTYKVNYTLNKTLTPTSFVTPVELALDGANSAYVLDGGSSTPILTKLPYATMIPSIVIPSGASVGGLAIQSPHGLTIDGYNNFYIADTGNNRIIQGRQNNAQYSQNTVYISSLITFGGTTLNGPTGLGLDAAGDLFIADTGNRRIVEYSVSGVPSIVSTTGVTLTNPTGVKVLPSGALVVADSTLGLVLVSGGAGSVMSTGSIKLSSTGGLALDVASNIYVADPTGGQVVELNLNSPGATSFPDTLKPDSTGTHTSKETSSIYNIGNSTLILSATPTVTDSTASATNEFSVDPNNACVAGTSLAPNATCGLTLDFTPSATAIVYTPTTGAATIADNMQAYSLVASPAFSSEDIASFGTAGSSQTVNLSGNAIVPFTAQSITFTAPAAVTYSASIPPIQLVATGGGTGNPVIFSIVSGTGVLSGTNNSILTLKDIGTTVVAANQAGGLANGVYYSAAPQVTQSAVVNPIGVVATPVFSVAGGTYTAVQSVTISDATAGATVYYTTNGNTPTTSSPVYTGQTIPVTVTTTIKAIAVGAPGYATSAVATATYTLNPDFILTPYVSNFTIPNGLGGSATLTITPEFGFTGTVALSCSGLSGKDACTFLDSNGNLTTNLVVKSTSVVYGSLIIQANETASASYRDPRGMRIPGAVLAMLLFFGGLRKRKRLATLMLLMLGIAGTAMMSGCGGASTTGKVHTSTFTLTATSGGVVHTQTITLNVDNLGN
ncbi:Chitobiase/beta-hexosaminidase C-terminal domain-containing protein [Granulicella rosea]|uniref:Chitobiase/beta-hexosaminidase C-terminal domain-containing protein n=1 Tax=Granulicella rosea TaxID=474952 RepID=A0A239JZW5_9BACT|nr:chitobiase/beta-hexosaminidase C-terminal domain-containing protein [Granulicella rosea]SNT10324.1 Chitobiase/beta-hexosaminidase C-terminal domain-containing protein [Granulicella rosea]